MARRCSRPDEAIEPAVDGLEDLNDLAAGLPAMPEQPLSEPSQPVLFDEAQPPAELEEAEPEPVILLCGEGPEAEAVARFAAACGFGVELLVKSESQNTGDRFPDAGTVHVTPDFLDIVDTCGIERNFYVCIFLDDPADCETILSQCVASRASYLGLMADRQTRDEIYAELKAGGAPDTELAAVCCPMGLSIGADSPERAAVAILAEILAARAGTLKRLRYED